MSEPLTQVALPDPVSHNQRNIPVVRDETRERAIVLVCVLAALALGLASAIGSEQTLVATFVTLVFASIAMIAPLSWITLALAAICPLQIYYPFAGSLAMRGALVLVFVAAVRVLARKVSTKELYRWPGWVYPAALFLLVALVAAIGAPNRYLALKGVYDWLPIFAAALVVGHAAQSEALIKRLVAVLIATGVGEALLGLIQMVLGLPRVVAILQQPISQVFFQPNSLREKLPDLSFNWVVFNHVLPFGTFINGIDYAIFLAAILSLVVALLLGRAEQSKASNELHGWQWPVEVGCAVSIGITLLQTFKGSGAIALAGGLTITAVFYLPRLKPRMLAAGAIMLGLAALLALVYSDAIIQRVVFLIQRESGLASGTGRTAIWMHLLTFLPQRPFFGYGLNNVQSLIEPLPSMNAGVFVFNFPSAESAYIAILLETGIIGFAALLVLITVVLTRAYRQVRDSRAPGLSIGVAAALVAILCGSLTVVGLTTDQNGLLLGILIGMVFGKWNNP